MLCLADKAFGMPGDGGWYAGGKCHAPNAVLVRARSLVYNHARYRSVAVINNTNLGHAIPSLDSSLVLCGPCDEVRMTRDGDA
jgi:hypothetical protein